MTKDEKIKELEAKIKDLEKFIHDILTAGIEGRKNER